MKYLEEDRNTQLYEEKSRLMYPEELKTMAQFDYEIVDATPIEIDEDTLYQVGTLQESCIRPRQSR